MTTIKLIFIFLSIAFYSCAQNPKKHKIDPEAVKLNNKIIELTRYIDNLDSCKKALVYLDSSTTIDSNYFLGYYNKLMFLYPLKQFEKAISTINSCIKLMPNAHDLYLRCGILYEKIGDSISSHKYFEKSLSILNPLLDTLKIRDLNYEMLQTNKAINLIMLGNNKIGNDILKTIYITQKEQEFKEMTLVYMNKSKNELIELMTNVNLPMYQ